MIKIKCQGRGERILECPELALAWYSSRGKRIIDYPELEAAISCPFSVRGVSAQLPAFSKFLLVILFYSTHLFVTSSRNPNRESSGTSISFHSSVRPSIILIDEANKLVLKNEEISALQNYIICHF